MPHRKKKERKIQLPPLPLPQPLARYAAKILFQFRVMIGTDPGIRRICEERTILFEALSNKEAIKIARQKAKDAAYYYDNPEGNTVYFEAVGIRDMIHLGDECEPDQVWYDIFQKVRPMERAAELTLTDAALSRRILGIREE